MDCAASRANSIARRRTEGRDHGELGSRCSSCHGYRTICLARKLRQKYGIPKLWSILSQSSCPLRSYARASRPPGWVARYLVAISMSLAVEPRWNPPQLQYRSTQLPLFACSCSQIGGDELAGVGVRYLSSPPSTSFSPAFAQRSTHVNGGTPTKVITS